MTTGPLSAELLVYAYSTGVFPMAEHRKDASVMWIEPRRRGILPLDRFHVSHSLRRVIRKGVFEIRTDTAFRDVMLNCADREETWINDRILEAYCQLFDLGLAHSVECWREEKLVGGLYGVGIGRCFFGESMFHAVPDASHCAFAVLAEMLFQEGCAFVDAQTPSEHMARFGAAEMPRGEYLERLERALGEGGGIDWEKARSKKQEGKG